MTAIARTGPWRDARVIGLIGLAHFLSHFYALALPPLFHLMRQDLAVGYTALGIAVSIYSIATAVLQTPVGLLVDRIGARWVLIAGLAVNAASPLHRPVAIAGPDDKTTENKRANDGVRGLPCVSGR